MRIVGDVVSNWKWENVHYVWFI